MEFNDFMGEEDTDLLTARKQAMQIDPINAPLSQQGQIVLSPEVLRLFKKKEGIEKVMEIFWIRYADLNDVAKLKRYWLLEPKHKEYLDFILAWNKDRWLAMYHIDLLGVQEKEIVKVEEKKEEEYLEIKPEAWVDNVQESELQKRVMLIDFETLESKPIEELWDIFKKTTNRNISPRWRSDRQWFIKELNKLRI